MRTFLSVRTVCWALAVGVAVGSGAYVASVSGQGTSAAPVSAAALDEFKTKVWPVLSNNCVTCHNGQQYAGDLDMEAFEDLQAVAKSGAIFEKMHDMLARGKMPPPTERPLAAADRATIMGWIERAHAVVELNADPAKADPGRVTARRLNRTEYNNTIRDLLGVTLRAADEFPLDDSGYGFDNIGDVLSISPMLMEKYIRAARTVSHAAVFGEPYKEGTRLAYLRAKKDQDDAPAVGEELPFSIRGALDGSFHFPVDAEYEFRFRYANFRSVNALNPAAGRGAAAGRGGGRGGRAGGAPGGDAPAAGAAGAPAAAPQAGATGGAPDPTAAAAGGGRGRIGGAPRPVTAEEFRAREAADCAAVPPNVIKFFVDGQPIYEYAVRGVTACEYARGESIVRTKLKAGDHALRISWPDHANLPDPTANYDPADGRRMLFVDYLDIRGPFNPSKEPPAGFKKIFICGAPGKYTAACARQIVENLATRAYRRPATPQDVQRLMALVTAAQKQDSFEEGIRVAIQAILVSPNFLFRVERDQPVAMSSAPSVPALALQPQRTGALASAPAPADLAYRISDYELASRLSYFLWATMPDDVLFDLAKKNSLHDKTVLDAQVKRMLADPKAYALVDNFGEQWLNLRKMDRNKPDATQFRKVDDELLSAMRKETRLFLNAVFTEDRSILDLIDGKFTFVNGPLARYYGIPGVNGEGFTRVELDGEQRSGLLTQASIMSISSYATRTSPVIRGKWVLDNLLGAPPPPPPDGVPALVVAGLGTSASMRERLAQHRANPACAACHNSMDPIGLSLENYDAAGGYRTKDGSFDIDNTGTLPDGRKIAGAKGLKESLRQRSDAFTEHFADRLMTYALGRGLEKSDRPVLHEITTNLVRNDYRFSVLVTSIVNSRPFLMRSRVTP